MYILLAAFFCISFSSHMFCADEEPTLARTHKTHNILMGHREEAVDSKADECKIPRDKILEFLDTKIRAITLTYMKTSLFEIALIGPAAHLAQLCVLDPNKIDLTDSNLIYLTTVKVETVEQSFSEFERFSQEMDAFMKAHLPY